MWKQGDNTVRKLMTVRGGQGGQEGDIQAEIIPGGINKYKSCYNNKRTEELYWKGKPKTKVSDNF